MDCQQLYDNHEIAKGEAQEQVDLFQLCDSANVIEKLNKEFDEIQTENQKLVEENDYKTEKNKKLENNAMLMSLYIRYKKIDSFTEQIHFWYDNGEYIQNKLDVDIDYEEEYSKEFCEWFPTYDINGFDIQIHCEVYEDNFEDYIINEVIEDY